MKPKAPGQIDAHVGARLRILRRGRGVSQSDLGAWLGVSYTQVQKYERGGIAHTKHIVFLQLGLELTQLADKTYTFQDDPCPLTDALIDQNAGR